MTGYDRIKKTLVVGFWVGHDQKKIQTSVGFGHDPVIANKKLLLTDVFGL